MMRVIPRAVSRDDIVGIEPRYVRLRDGSLLRMYRACSLVEVHMAPPRGVALPTRYAEDLIPDLHENIIVVDGERHVLAQVEQATDFGVALTRLNRMAERHGGFFVRTEIDDTIVEAMLEQGVVPMRVS